MFISKLRAKLLAYDQYGIHRTNAFKAFFISQFLFIFNLLYTIHNPYFYYFYVPLTAFAAEIAGITLEDKYLFLFLTITGSAVSIFIFGLFAVYPKFFALVVFFYTVLLYRVVITKLPKFLMLVPLILSLASYSLIYTNQNSNLYNAFNHATQTIFAMLLIFAGLLVFPKRYYLGIWYKAFCEVVLNLVLLSEKIYTGDLKNIPIFSGIIVMERHSKMLSKNMKCFSLLKLTILAFELIMSLSYMSLFRHNIKKQYIKVFNDYLGMLHAGVVNKKPVFIRSIETTLFDEMRELKILYQLIQSWNYVCADL